MDGLTMDRYILIPLYLLAIVIITLDATLWRPWW